jgi:NAD(P)H-hydrate epimerase
MTTNDETVNFIRDAVRLSPVPLIIDADGINALAKIGDDIENENNQPLILTPHPGEFSRLTGVPTPELLSNQLEITRLFSQDNGVWVVLKTHRTLIASPNGQLFVSPTGNPGMATAGMGDVLTGVLTSLVGQAIAEGAVEEADITGAICLAVYLHGLAGDIAAESTGQASLTAGDVISTLEDSHQALIEYQ